MMEDQRKFTVMNLSKDYVLVICDKKYIFSDDSCHIIKLIKKRNSKVLVQYNIKAIQFQGNYLVNFLNSRF
jgi:predicted nuclease of restriction endonuclease-like (RecB) superfamily